jgi:TRAP-type C4-dicarboxylate transport system substrate-binding protein
MGLVAYPGLANAKTYTMRIQSVYPETSHGPQMLKQFAAKVKEYTGGKVKVRLFWPGQLVHLKEGYDAISKGMVEGLYSCLIYYGGIVPEGKTEWLPFTWRNPAEAYDMYVKAGYLDLLRKANEQHGVHYLFPIMSATMGAMTKFPVKSLADFKGKKMRATGLDGPIVKKLGSAAVSLPATEMYITLQRGTVDGVIYPFYTLRTYKLYEVVNYVVRPGFHTPAISGVYLNLEFWKSLPADLQKAVDKAGLETFHQSSLACVQWDKEAVDEAAKRGVKIVDLPEADVKKMRELCLPLWSKVGKSTPLSGKIVELFTSYLKEKGAI